MASEPRDPNQGDAIILMTVLAFDTTGRKCTLRNLIGALDKYGIPTFEDLNGGLARLEAYGLIRAVEDRFTATESARAVKAAALPPGGNPLDYLRALERVLASSLSSLPAEPRAGLISEAQYQDAINWNAWMSPIKTWVAFAIVMGLVLGVPILLIALGWFLLFRVFQ
jgi:hypothetical protein